MVQQKQGLEQVGQLVRKEPNTSQSKVRHIWSPVDRGKTIIGHAM